MSGIKKIQQRKERRLHRVRAAQNRGDGRLRLSVHRTLKQLHAQLIDDRAGVTIASFSSLHLTEASGNKKERAKAVGLELGALIKKQGVSEIFFDRGSYKFHGRVAALAEGLRECGLKF